MTDANFFDLTLLCLFPVVVLEFIIFLSFMRASWPSWLIAMPYSGAKLKESTFDLEKGVKLVELL